MGLKTEDLLMSTCDYKYWDFVQSLRNNPKVSDGFINPDFITVSMQTEYMSKYWKNYYICLWNTGQSYPSGYVPVGYVGIIDNDIRVCVHPDFQRLGIGKFMINYIKHFHPKAIAKIKMDNEASIKLFESCGFKQKYIIMEQK